MAVSLGFGVVFATAITLILIPTSYRILEDLKGLYAHHEEEVVEDEEEDPGFTTVPGMEPVEG